MTRRSLSILAAATLGLVSLPHAVKADPPLPETQWHTCRPTESMIWHGSRYHIKCDTPMWTGLYRDIPIYYFAIPDTSASQVQQAMDITHTAIKTTKKVAIHAFTASTKNPPGCLASDCRFFDAVMVLSP